jgi:Tol biopolymer transport system component/tRNA A-37 threonylcarbamoyl transferase component Bud32
VIGKVISHYKIFERLGHGAMGIVYRGEDTRLGRPVALKFLPEEVSEDKQAFERMHREARASSALNHPNICTIYDIDEYEGQPFLVMELLHGQTLREVIHGKPLPVNDVIEYGIEIADALDTAHKQGIIHRDVKPANLYITTRNLAKILDFGVAKITDERRSRRAGVTATATATVTQTSDESLTKSGSAVGTVAYMSPEQARGEKLDGRSDIFGLGVVLYEMATGQQAFRGDTTAVIFDAILNRTPPSSHELNPKVPEELERCIMTCLEKDRELRYQTAAELRADLKRLKRDVETGRVRTRRRGRGWATTTAITVGLAVGLTAAALFVGARLGWIGPRAADSGGLRSTPLTANPPTKPLLDAAISPDGKYLAYVDSSGFYLQLIGAGETHRLEVPAGLRGNSVSWFPDGARLVLGAIEGDGATSSLWLASILGGEAKKFRDDASTAAVSPDGSLIAFLPGRGRNEIWMTDMRGAEPRRMATAPARTRYARLTWATDNDRLVVSGWKQTADGNIGFIETRGVLDHAVHTLVEGSDFTESVEAGLWGAPKGRILYCRAEAAPHQTDSNLWEVRINERTGDRSGKPRRLTDWAGTAVRAPSVTYNGSRLVVLKSHTRTDVMVATIGAPGADLTDVRAITKGEGDAVPSGWRPDGDAVLFTTDRNGTLDVYEQSLSTRASAAAAVAVAALPDEEAGGFVSGDPPTTFYWTWQRGEGSRENDARLMRIQDGGMSARPVLTGRRSSIVFQGSIAPGKPFLAFSLDPKDRKMTVSGVDVVKSSMEAESEFTVDLDAWIQFVPSPDGKRIAVLAADGRIRVYGLNGQRERDVVLAGWEDGLREIAWSVDGERLYGAWGLAGAYAMLDIEMSGVAHAVWRTSDAPPANPLPSPDGKHIAFARARIERNAYLMDDVRSIWPDLARTP